MDKVFVIGRDAVPERVQLQAGEKLRWTLLYDDSLCDSSAVAVRTEIELCGPGADADIAGLYLCRGDSVIDFDITVRHSSGGCTSRQLFKGMAGGNSKAGFDGLIYVAPDAQKTKAFQENHTILLSDTAHIRTQPQLEIYADDVECSHGATTGYLNPDEQFYMRSRGIPEDEARRLQILSFISPILQRLPEETAREIEDSL